MTILVVSNSCSKLTEFLHVTFISVVKHCPVIFFRWVALHFGEITYAKKCATKKNGMDFCIN